MVAGSQGRVSGGEDTVFTAVTFLRLKYSPCILTPAVHAALGGPRAGAGTRPHILGAWRGRTGALRLSQISIALTFLTGNLHFG